ncbi:hypothetical protein [uncultured Pseudodesulfovibrio sp.]|uniref:hypothetical protein n=1 Tax=uncultured Pseudodesulfovibrio sp. TaxID=2035858 RepID=UPI0029C62D4C|nr:hypothetical protein [uncultured Pseudodesulfovibrio sp.]
MVGERVAYFLENLSQIKGFLSLVSPEDENVFVLADNASLIEFIGNIFPQAQRHVVERIPYWQNNSLYIELLEKGMAGRSRFDFLAECDRCVFFNAVESVHFHIILDHIASKGAPVVFANAYRSVDSHMVRMADKDLTAEQGAFLNEIRRLSGLALYQYRVNNTWDMFGLDRAAYPEIPLHILPWRDIARKVPYHVDLGDGECALLIDSPVDKFVVHDIDLEASRANIVEFFSKRFAEGLSLLVKPHPASTKTTFTGTILEDRVRLLDKAFPVELVMHRVPAVYFFSSSTIAAETDGRLFCLMDLVEFNSDRGRREAYEILRTGLGDNGDKVEFIPPAVASGGSLAENHG